MVKKLFAKIYNYLLLGDFSKNPTFDKKYKWKVLSFLNDVVSPLSESDRFKFSDVWGRHIFIGKLLLILIFILSFGITIGLVTNYGYTTNLNKKTEKMSKMAEHFYSENISNKDSLINEKQKNDSLLSYFNSREWKEYVIYKEAKIFIPEYLPDSIFFLMESERIKYDIPNTIYWRLIKQESDFRMVTNKKSGARGYMQVMPPTFNQFKDTVDACKHDHEGNIKVGAYYLRSRYDKYIRKGFTDEKAWVLALSAYNAGEGNVMKAGYEIPNFTETKKYVSFIIKNFKKNKEEEI